MTKDMKENSPFVLKELMFRGLLFISIVCTVQFLSSDGAKAQIADSYRLVGMIRSTHFTGIVLSDQKGVQSFYRVSDKLPDGSQIVEVRPESITIKGTDGTSYDMYISSYTSTADATASTSIRPVVPAKPYTPEVAQDANPAKKFYRLPKSHGRHTRTRSPEDD